MLPPPRRLPPTRLPPRPRRQARRDGLVLLRLGAVPTLVVSSPLTAARREGQRACLHACGGHQPPHSRRQTRLPARATAGQRSALASPARDSASAAAGATPRRTGWRALVWDWTPSALLAGENRENCACAGGQPEAAGFVSSGSDGRNVKP